jgi:hypothetical protein
MEQKHDWKAFLSEVMSVRPCASAWNDPITTGLVLFKFHFWGIFTSFFNIPIFLDTSKKRDTLSNVLYTYRQNIVLGVVYLLVLRYMFRPVLGHHQAFWRYII